MAWPRVVLLGVLWGLLSSAPAWAQPSGSGWIACGVDEAFLKLCTVPALSDGQFAQSAWTYRPGALCSEPLTEPSVGHGQAGPAEPYTFDYGQCCTEDYSDCIRDDAAQAWYRIQNFEGSDAAQAQRVADLAELWLLGLGALASLWAMKQFVLKLLTNQ